MEELKFKTNINCTGCLSKVKPVLDAEQKIDTWEVDLEHEDRILTVKSENISSGEIEEKLAAIGFEADQDLV